MLDRIGGLGYPMPAFGSGSEEKLHAEEIHF